MKLDLPRTLPAKPSPAANRRSSTESFHTRFPGQLDARNPSHTADVGSHGVAPPIAPADCELVRSAHVGRVPAGEAPVHARVVLPAEPHRLRAHHHVPAEVTTGRAGVGPRRRGQDHDRTQYGCQDHPAPLNATHRCHLHASPVADRPRSYVCLPPSIRPADLGRAIRPERREPGCTSQRPAADALVRRRSNHSPALVNRITAAAIPSHSEVLGAPVAASPPPAAAGSLGSGDRAPIGCVAVQALSRYGLVSLSGWNSYLTPTWYVRSTVVAAFGPSASLPRTVTVRPSSVWTIAVRPALLTRVTVPVNWCGEVSSGCTHEAWAGAGPRKLAAVARPAMITNVTTLHARIMALGRRSRGAWFPRPPYGRGLSRDGQCWQGAVAARRSSWPRTPPLAAVRGFRQNAVVRTQPPNADVTVAAPKER